MENHYQEKEEAISAYLQWYATPRLQVTT